MGKDSTLKKTYQFKRVYNHGSSVADRILVVYSLQTNTTKRRIGYSVSKKVGKAVTRNRVKRLFREVYRHNNSQLITGVDIILIARNPIVDASYHQIEDSFNKLCQKAKLVKE
ncbi:ribonuclease P protein component [Halanaerobaculum tunisiense]